MQIAYSKTALKQMKAIHPKIAKTIREKIEQYADDPNSLANQVKQLRGNDCLRLRVGNYRIIFTEDGVVMLVLEVGHRREIYN